MSVAISSLSANLAESQWATQQNGSSGSQLSGMLSGEGGTVCERAGPSGWVGFP